MLDIHFRIHDKFIIEQLESISIMRNISKSALCKYLCENGIDSEYKRVMNIQASLETDEILAPTISLLKELNESMKNIDINKELQNSMLSVMYKMLSCMMMNEVMDIKAIELGMYDSLPKRFVDKLDALMLINN